MNTLKLFGPPGTGKTHRLLQIMEQELKSGVAPERLAYLSFTVQARKEALHRAMGQFNFTKDRLPYFRTLHAICYKELEPGKQAMLVSNDDLIEFGHRQGLHFTPSITNFETEFTALTGNETGDRLLKFDHLRRHYEMSVRDAWTMFLDSDGLSIFTAERFCKAYADWKEEEGRYDFTDLLQSAIQPLPVDVVIVDEAQDFSNLQWSTLRRLASTAKRLYLAGDDDQAIFTWAGASPAAFRAQPGKVDILHQSYRIPQAVHSLAIDLVSRIKDRQPKTWLPRAEKGSLKFLMDAQQIQFPQDGSLLILYRHHFQSFELEEHLQREGLPYLRNDKPASGLQWGKHIVAWEKLRKGGPVAWTEAQHAISAMSVGHDITSEGAAWADDQPLVGDTTIHELQQHGVMATGPWFESLRKIPMDKIQYIRAVLRQFGNEGLTKTPRVRCTTIHAAKGSEADHVIVVGDLAKKSHASLDRDPDGERRVFYVGLTRARQSLTIVGNDNPLLAPFFWSGYGR